MSRIDLLIDQIIKRAQNTADAISESYPAEIERELFETHLTKEEFLRSKIKEEASSEKILAKWYNVKNTDHLRLVLFMAIDSRDWPITGTAKMRNPLPDNKMYHRKFISVLWPLFLRINRIEYLNGLIEPQAYKTGLHSKLSDPQLETVYTTFKNKYFATTTEKQFFAAFRPDPLPEGWQRIYWTGTQSHIRYFVKLVTEKDHKPEKLKEFITGKTIDSNNQKDYDSLLEKTFLEAIK